MSEKVVALNSSSAAAVPCRAADPKVIEELERLIEQAKSGELIGVAIAMLHPGDLTSWTTAGRTTRGLLGATVLLQGDMVKVTLENE